MRLLLPVKECFGRVFEKKVTLIAFAVLFVVGIALGIVFVKTPAIYDYHLNRCERFMDSVCFSDRSVFLIFLERLAGHTLILALLLAAGIHPVGLVITPIVIVFRAYTFGGSLAIFFSVYRMTGILIAIAFYIPVHIMFDCIFLAAVALSFYRAFSFRFCRPDFGTLLRDFLIFLIFTAIVCIAEILLLLMLFHSVGNIL